MDTKKCTQCGEYKPLTDFHRRFSSKDGRQSKCKPCNHESAVQWQEKNAEKATKVWKNKVGDSEFLLKRKSRLYGISPDELQNLYDSNSSCMICGTIPSNGLHIDHDHSSGVVRGLLCMRCNTALGLFKDNAENLANAIEYLENTKPL